MSATTQTDIPRNDQVKCIHPDIPSITKEFEIKLGVESEKKLQKMIKKSLKKMPSISDAYAKMIAGGYIEKTDTPQIAKAHSISWYMDDKDHAALSNDVFMRTSLAVIEGKIDDNVQHCVKGKSQKFNGKGGSERHEDSINTDTKVFSPHFFKNEDTQTMLREANTDELFYYFATDLDRKMIGAYVKTPHGRAMFEIAFDTINFIAPDNDAKNAHSFHKRNEIEIEYIHPIDEDGYRTPMAEKLNLSVLTKAQIEESITIIKKEVEHIAKKSHIELTAEGNTKGGRGFYEQLSQRAGTRLSLDDPRIEDFLNTVPQYD